MEQAATSTALNATVDGLCRFVPDEIEGIASAEMAAYTSAVNNTGKGNGDNAAIERFLEKTFNAKKFILLSRSVRQSSAAVALYAGDGLVIKITEKSYHEPRIRPQGLPPIGRTYEVKGNSKTFEIGIFPWVNNKDVNDNDVKEMRAILEKNGLEFQGGDARTDNIGKLADDKTLVVLDGNAVEFIDDKYEKSHQYREQRDKWIKCIYKDFGHLYNRDPDDPIRLSDDPDFTPHFSQPPKKIPSEKGRSHTSRIEAGIENGAGFLPWSFP